MGWSWWWRAIIVLLLHRIRVFTWCGLMMIHCTCIALRCRMMRKRPTMVRSRRRHWHWLRRLLHCLVAGWRWWHVITSLLLWLWLLIVGCCAGWPLLRRRYLLLSLEVRRLCRCRSYIMLCDNSIIGRRHCWCSPRRLWNGRSFSMRPRQRHSSITTGNRRDRPTGRRRDRGPSGKGSSSGGGGRATGRRGPRHRRSPVQNHIGHRRLTVTGRFNSS